MVRDALVWSSKLVRGKREIVFSWNDAITSLDLIPQPDNFARYNCMSSPHFYICSYWLGRMFFVMIFTFLILYLNIAANCECSTYEIVGLHCAPSKLNTRSLFPLCIMMLLHFIYFANDMHVSIIIMLTVLSIKL